MFRTVWMQASRIPVAHGGGTDFIFARGACARKEEIHREMLSSPSAQAFCSCWSHWAPASRDCFATEALAAKTVMNSGSDCCDSLFNDVSFPASLSGCFLKGMKWGSWESRTWGASCLPQTSHWERRAAWSRTGVIKQHANQMWHTKVALQPGLVLVLFIL